MALGSFGEKCQKYKKEFISAQVSPEAGYMVRMVENEEKEEIGIGEACALALQARPSHPRDACPDLRKHHHISRTPAGVVVGCPRQQQMPLWAPNMCFGGFLATLHHTPSVSC